MKEKRLRKIIMGLLTLILIPLQIFWIVFLWIIATGEGLIWFIIWLLGICFGELIEKKLLMEKIIDNGFGWWIFSVREYILGEKNE